MGKSNWLWGEMATPDGSYKLEKKSTKRMTATPLYWLLNIAVMVVLTSATLYTGISELGVSPSKFDGGLLKSIGLVTCAIAFNFIQWAPPVVLAFIIWLFKRKDFGKKLFYCLISIAPLMWGMAFYGSRL